MWLKRLLWRFLLLSQRGRVSGVRGKETECTQTGLGIDGIERKSTREREQGAAWAGGLDDFCSFLPAD